MRRLADRQGQLPACPDASADKQRQLSACYEASCLQREATDCLSWCVLLTGKGNCMPVMKRLADWQRQQPACHEASCWKAVATACLSWGVLLTVSGNCEPVMMPLADRNRPKNFTFHLALKTVRLCEYYFSKVYLCGFQKPAESRLSMVFRADLLRKVRKNTKLSNAQYKKM